VDEFVPVCKPTRGGPSFLSPICSVPRFIAGGVTALSDEHDEAEGHSPVGPVALIVGPGDFFPA
jgi:hypothetical protein